MNPHDDDDRLDPATPADVVDLDAARSRRDADARTGASPDPDVGRVLVDAAEVQVRAPVDWTGLDRTARRPIAPAWLRSRAEAGTAARWAAGYAAHALAYHVTRSPKYAAKLLLRAPRGLWRVTSGSVRWTLDLEGEPVRQATVRREDAEYYLKLSRQRDNRVRLRVWVTGFALALLCAGAGTLAVAGTGWQRWTALAVLVAVLGMVGAPADRPLLDTAVLVPRVARLTSDVVVRALSVLGIAGISQALARNPRAVSFPAPITRDGPGWRADIDLPAGVTAAEVIDRRDKLAAGLGRPLGCVWPEGQHEVHPGRLLLWVGDQDVATVRQPAWPLLRSGGADVFRPLPFGTDPRGRVVAFELMYTNLLIGSIPGYGKTFALRLPLLAAALDVRAELWVFELKGTGDLEPLAQVAARYGSGADDDVVEAALLALRDLRTECTRRAGLIRGLPKSVCPENMVTPELASRKGFGLHPLVVAIDECQELFTHPDFGSEARELAEKLIKLGRALGVVLLLATQRPDSKSVPTGVSAQVGTRFCLRVMGQLENDMILGTSAYRNGTRATMFTRRDKGVGYLVGAGDEPQITRTFYVDGPAAEAVCARARALREHAGTLSGHAAGAPVPAPAVRRERLLDDVLTVIGTAEAKLWTDTVVERLTVLRPEAYGQLTREQLTAALKPYGISTGQVWGTDPATGQGANRRGITRADVAAVITARDHHRAGTKHHRSRRDRRPG